MTYITIIILGGLTLAIIIMIAIYNKKNKNKLTDEEQKIKNAISITNQHLTYKNEITKQTVISNFGAILITLGMLFIIFLPIFQIKYEVLDVTIAEKNFSLINTFFSLINKHNKKTGQYTDVDIEDGMFTIVCYCLSLFIVLCIGGIVLSIFFNTNKKAEKVYIAIKTDRKGFIDKYAFVQVLVCILLIFFTIFKFANAEYKVSDKTEYTIKTIDNFLYYYTNNGELAFKVYQNDFKFCNGVSGYIAIPIICFVVGLIMYIVGQYLKHKLIADISNEKLDEPQAVETINENDNIE